MSTELKNMFPLWLSCAQADARGDLARAQQSLASLKNRQGSYFEAISALCVARQQVYDFWMTIPHEPSAVLAGRAAQAAAVKVPALLSEHEQRAILRDPVAIARLIGHHDCEEAGADAIEPGWGSGHERRALELLAIGRAVIAEDPDLWTEAERREFALRHSERAAATANTPTPGDAK